jgi:hypothetical protein
MPMRDVSVSPVPDKFGERRIPKLSDGGIIDDPLKMSAFAQRVFGYSPKKETTVDKNYFQNLKEFGIPDEPKVVRDNVVQVKPTPPHKETIPYDPLYKFNPKNWGVPDYTHFGSRDKAYIEARKAGEKEFMWNNNRFNTLNSGTPTQQFNMYGNTNAMVMSKADDKTKEKIIKNSFVGNSMDAEELERRFTLNTLVGTPSYKHGATHPTQEEAYAKFRKQPLEKSKKELMDEYRKISRIRPSYNPFTNTIYGDDITAEEAHAYRNTEKSEIISFIKDYIKYPFFTEDQQLAGYTNRDHFEFDTHRIVEPVLESYLSGEIEKEDIPIYIKKLREQNQKYLSNKNNLKNTFNTNDLKLFYPYTEKSNKYKIQRLQKILSEKGYKLPKSTKEDGTFDGVWGEETETALNDYRKKINSKYQNGGWLDSYQKGGVIDDPLKMPAFLQKWGYKPKKETTVDKNYFQNLKEFGIPDEPKVAQDKAVMAPMQPFSYRTEPNTDAYGNPIPTPTYLKSDDRTDFERQQAQNLMDEYNNPTFLEGITIGARKTLRAFANPFDIGNLQEQEDEYRFRNMNPNISDADKFKANVNEGAGVAAWGALNLIPFEGAIGQAIVKKIMGNGYSKYVANPLYSLITEQGAKNLSKPLGNFNTVGNAISAADNSIVDISKNTIKGGDSNYIKGLKKLIPEKEYLIGNYKQHAIKELKKAAIAFSPKTTKALGKLDDSIAKELLWEYRFNTYPSIKDFRKTVNKSILESNRLKKIYPNVDFSKYPEYSFALKNPETLKNYVAQQQAIDQTIKSQKNLLTYIDKGYTQKKNIIDQNPIFKNISNESPQYTNIIYEHMINPKVNDDIFINNLIKQSNTFTRSTNKYIPPEDVLKVKGKSLTEGNNMTIDVESFPVSDNYGAYTYKIEPNKARMDEIASFPIEERWAQRYPNKYSKFNETVDVKNGWLTGKSEDYANWYGKRALRLRNRENVPYSYNIRYLQADAMPSAVYARQPRHVIFSSPLENQSIEGFDVSQIDIPSKDKFTYIPGYTLGFQNGGEANWLNKYE